MTKNRNTLRSAMDRRLSFLDDVPSCRAAVLHRIAQEEKPVMKKKISAGFVFAMVLVLLTAAALGATLLLSPGASASLTADRALEKEYGITAEMQSFFHRGEEVMADGTVKVTYTGNAEMEYVLGTYTAVVKDGKAEISWSHAGEDTSGGYESEAWGPEQLKQMIKDSPDERTQMAYLNKAAEIAKRHGITQDNESSESDPDWQEKIEARKTAALNARRISEEEMIRTGRDFIISNYGLDEEQIQRLELYTNFDRNARGANGTEGSENSWYDMIGGRPCFKVEYLLGQSGTDGTGRGEKDGYYVVYINVETGEIETYEYNSGLSGLG